MPGKYPATHAPQYTGELLDTQTPPPVAQVDFSLSFQNQLTGALGEDESNANAASGYALTCENCFDHNGLVRDGVDEDMQHVCFKCSHFNPSACSQKKDHLLTSTSPYQPTSPVVIPSRGQRHSTLITSKQTICNRGREEQQNVADMNSFTDSQALQSTNRPMRVLPKFDPYLDDPLPLTPSGHTPLVHAVQHTQPPATQLEAEIAEGDILYQLAFRKVVRLRNGQVVKCGPGLRPEEAITMIYIAAHTTVPIPGNVQFVEENGKTYLIMDYIEGTPLRNVWPYLLDDEKRNIFAELRGYVNQWRALQPERSGYVGSLNYGPCLDRRVVGFYHCGPFDTEHQFHDHVAATLRPEIRDERRKFLRNMMKDNHSIVFSHGDMHARNILIRDGHVVGILDWEMAGWYPEYWEWCKALWAENWEMEGWCTSLKEFLQPYDYEYALDRLLLSNSDAWW